MGTRQIEGEFEQSKKRLRCVYVVGTLVAWRTHIVRTLRGKTMATTAARTDRIALRTSKEQKSFLEKGASATGQNLTEFVLSSAQEKAEIVLADQNRFVISPKQWDAFVTALDRPATLKKNLARLMSEPSVLER